MMRRPIIAANWKLNKTVAEARQFVVDLQRQLPEAPDLDVVLAAPFTALAAMQEELQGTPFHLAAQNVFWERSGAYTGEISAAMLKDVGCRYVIVGHSERRALYKEDDALVARKFLAVHGQGLLPILCVGETLEERERGLTSQVVSRQLTAVLDLAGVEALGASVLAYEPVWAIGTGKNATPDQAQEVHAHIRSVVAARDAKIAARLRILYGGSVKASNAREIFAMPDVDGGLVGGASLKADEFLKICAAAQVH